MQIFESPILRAARGYSFFTSCRFGSGMVRVLGKVRRVREREREKKSPIFCLFQLTRLLRRDLLLLYSFRRMASRLMPNIPPLKGLANPPVLDSVLQRPLQGLGKWLSSLRVPRLLHVAGNLPKVLDTCRPCSQVSLRLHIHIWPPIVFL